MMFTDILTLVSFGAVVSLRRELRADVGRNANGDPIMIQ